jgi:hypothetical protein
MQEQKKEWEEEFNHEPHELVVCGLAFIPQIRVDL